MRKQDIGFDYHRYKQLLADAVDEKKRLELINILIEERAVERLEAQRASDRAAMLAMTIAKVLAAPRNEIMSRVTDAQTFLSGKPTLLQMANKQSPVLPRRCV